MKPEKLQGHGIEDTDARERAIEVFESRNRAFRVLYDTVIEVEGVTGDAVHQILCRNLLRLCQADSVALASFDEERSRFRLAAVAVADGLPSFEGDIGRSAEATAGLVDDLRDTRVKRCCEHSNCVIALFPDSEFARSGHDACSCYRVSAVRGGRLVATCAIRFASGQKLRLKDMVETYLSLAGMILQRVRSERVLRERERQFRTAFEASPLPMGISRLADGCVLDANEGLCQLLQKSLDGVRGARVVDLGLWPGDGSLEAERAALLAGRSLKGCELRTQLPGGRERILALSAECVEVAGESCVLGVYEDVTERRRNEQEFINAQKMESLGVLAGGIAHDFNNVLSGIASSIALARLALGESGEASDILEEAERGALRARGLTQQLLTFARGGKPVKEPLALRKVVEAATALSLLGTTAAPDIELPGDLWSLLADEGQLQQVFNNVFINAAQAMTGGGRVRITARNETLSDAGDERSDSLAAGRYLRVEVVDDGCGIPDEILPRVFDPYFTTRSEGPGLGLTAAYSIVQKHGGHMELASRPGHGTTVTILLPAAEEKKPKPRRRASGLQRGSGRVLIMDDEPLIRMTLSRILGKLGYEVDTAPHGEDAIEQYRAAASEGRPFSAIILDLTVPGGMGGEETFAAIRELDPDVRAIVSSGYSEDPIMAEFDRYGFRARIMKPCDMRELSHIVYRVTSG